MKYAAAWHRESWEKFLRQSLPELLGEACGVTGYSVRPRGETCELHLSIDGGRGDVAVTYREIPFPDEAGVFHFEGRPVVLVPEGEDETLDRVRCGGELACDYLKRRIGRAGGGVLKDASAVRNWLPLGEWIAEFFREESQPLDIRNWISRATHLRRVRLCSIHEVSSQTGRACPVETPEGPNLGRVLTVALGARIRDGKVVKVSDRPGDALGVSASLIPFFEYNDPARLLMGANMMRQWIPPQNGENPMVFTGNEIGGAEGRLGFNLLTAFASMGRATVEDAIVLSETAAERMRYEIPIEIGDKFSNRHGTKGVVSAVLPENKMPRLPDGTAVECVFSFIGLHTRMNAGQLLEAVLSRIAGREEGEGAAPAFESPSRDRLFRRLKDLGLSEDGLEYLEWPGENAKSNHRPEKRSAFPTLAGWIYWGRTVHVARDKVKISGGPEPCYQLQGAMEYYALRDAGAFAVIAERNGMTALDAPDSDTLARRIAEGEEPAPGEETASFLHLSEFLRRGGIRLEGGEDGLRCRFIRGEGIELARPVPHPWRSSELLENLPEAPEEEGFRLIVESNARLKKLVDSGAPQSLVRSSFDVLQERIRRYISGLVRSIDVTARGRLLFSGRSVIVPARDLTVEEMGLPEEIAWPLCRPLVAREAGSNAVENRSEEAVRILDRVLSESTVLLNRAPTYGGTNMLAFRPVRVAHRALEFHPLVCRWMNADFDGDQMAVFLPITEDARKDLRDRLSVVGHLSRDPSLLETLLPTHEALWGLAWMSLGRPGRERICGILGTEPVMPDGFLTAAVLTAAVAPILERKGAATAVGVAEALMDLGLEAVHRSGASFNPFMKPSDPYEGGKSSPDAKADPIGAREAMEELMGSDRGFSSPCCGPQLLATKCGARGSLENLLMLMHGRRIGETAGAAGFITCAGLDGLPPGEFHQLCGDVRGRMAALTQDILDCADYYRDEQPKGYTLLARAARAEEPGIVFASAAASGEIDPLLDLDARLFMGLPV